MNVPNDCKTCSNRYNDITEGHNCTKYDATGSLPSGDSISVPGQNVSSAYLVCKGDGYEPSRFWLLKWWLGL